MAGDWLKIEKATARKREVMVIADILGLHPDHAFGICFRFWAWCDDNLTDGHAKSVTLVTVDSLLGHNGFGQAAQKAGWITESDDGFVIPNFDRHLSECAKNRALSTERKRKQRGKPVTEMSQNSVTKTGPEKRREENIREREEAATLSTFDYSDSMPKQAAGVMLDIERKIQTIHVGWDIPLTYEAQQSMMRNRGTILGIDAKDGWRLIKNYYKARLPKGMPEYRPPSCERFIRDVGDVYRYALEWEAKQTPQRPARAISAQTNHTPTPDDEAALAEFLKTKPRTAKL